MAMNLAECGLILSQEGVRHHMDAEDAAIRCVFVTRHFVNPRGERIAIVRIETPDSGHRLRVSIPRAFSPGKDPAAICLALCRLAADTPLVAVEYDAELEDVRLVAEAAVEDGSMTPLQLLSMVDRIVEAAEAWQVGLEALRDARPTGRRAKGRGAA